MFIKSYSLFNNLIVFLTPTSHTAPGSAFKMLFVGNMALSCTGGISPLLGQLAHRDQVWGKEEIWGDQHSLDLMLTWAEHEGPEVGEL